MRKLLYCFLISVVALISCSNSNLAPKAKSPDGEDFAMSKKTTQKVSKSSQNKSLQPFPELNLDFLFLRKDKKEQLDETQRNLATMEEDPEVVAERKRREEEAKKQAEIAAKKAEEERKKREEELAKNPPPPQPPPINFEFIGYLGPGGKRIGIFRMSAKEEELVLKRKGEKIGEDFIVVDIGYESAEIGFEGFKETKMIPLVSGGK